MSDTKPCGQHTVWEPQCRTCARLAGLEKERDEALADRDRLREVMADVASHAHGMGQAGALEDIQAVIALADRGSLATLGEFQPALDALEGASMAWALAGKFGSPEERAKTEAEYDRAREHLVSLCQATLSRNRREGP